MVPSARQRPTALLRDRVREPLDPFIQIEDVLSKTFGGLW